MKFTHIKKQEGLFACPHCKAAMKLVEDKSLICPSGHLFDLSRLGYINFLLKPVKSDYNKEMLASRRRVIKEDFFSPLLKAISPFLPEKGTILDAGCGEGSQLNQLLEAHPTLEGAGIDISKEGISLAARDFKQEVWVVGDLADPPFQPASFQGIINILSPANYESFSRLLKPQGRLIKVVPQQDYLKELRMILFRGKAKENSSSREVEDLFKKSFPLIRTSTITYQFPLTQELLPHFLAMTPLTWRRDISFITLKQLPLVTLSFKILVGEKESN